MIPVEPQVCRDFVAAKSMIWQEATEAVQASVARGKKRILEENQFFFSPLFKIADTRLNSEKYFGAAHAATMFNRVHSGRLVQLLIELLE